MSRSVTRPRRRAAVGITAMVAGAASLVVGVAGQASAHEGTEPIPIPDKNLDCVDIAELLHLDVDWEQFKIEPFPDENGEYDYTLSDRGTPDDESDDAVFTIDVFDRKRFDWSSTVGIDAIFVKGGAGAGGSYLYYFGGEELTEDVDYTVPPYGHWDKNAISHITICWDDEDKPPTTSPTTSPPTSDTTAPPTSDTTAPPSSDTTATTAPSSSSSVAPSTTVTTPSSTISSDEELPRTGSNSTTMLVAIGAGLLLAGAVLVASTRKVWRRYI